MFLKNKYRNKAVLAHSFLNESSYFPFGVPITLTPDNKLIMKVDAQEIIAREGYLYRKEVKDSPARKEFYKLTDEMAGNMNPVIFIYQLKF